MKYAVISDVHGNLNALSAVLADAKNSNVDNYIFVGDYCSYLPYPNEVINTIKNLQNSIVIHGNEEGYLFEYAKQDQSGWTDGQFQSHYWCYKNIDCINHCYLRELPKFITLNDNGFKISITHSSSDFFGDVEHREFRSSKVAVKYQDDPDYSKEKLLYDIREYINHDTSCRSAFQSLTNDIYIFGHTHVQWFARHENKVFINPGSCGLPLDGLSGAPYTILNIENDQIHIDERRILYDMDKLISDFQNSSLYEAALAWNEIILKEIKTGYESVHFFLQFVNDYANKINDTVRPFSKKTWSDAYNLWKML